MKIKLRVNNVKIVQSQKKWKKKLIYYYKKILGCNSS